MPCCVAPLPEIPDACMAAIERFAESALTLAEDYGVGERNGGTGGGTIDQAQVGYWSKIGCLALWDLWGMRIG